jgi:hypothetical protein
MLFAPEGTAWRKDVFSKFARLLTVSCSSDLASYLREGPEFTLRAVHCLFLLPVGGGSLLQAGVENPCLHQPKNLACEAASKLTQFA